MGKVVYLIFFSFSIYLEDYTPIHMYKYVVDKVFQGKWRFRYHTPYFPDQLVLVKLILFKKFIVFIPTFQRKFITYLLHKESAKTQAKKYKDITTMKSQKNKLNSITKKRKRGEKQNNFFMVSLRGHQRWSKTYIRFRSNCISFGNIWSDFWSPSNY